MLAKLPDLPAKFGFAVDCGPAPLLSAASADIRIERGAHGLILRLDGSPFGRPVTEPDVPDAVLEMAAWFAEHRTFTHRRMARVVAYNTPPVEWTVEQPLSVAALPTVGPHPMGALLGAAFGQIDAGALARIVRTTGATALRVTPWRLFLLERAGARDDPAFVTQADDPLLATDACPGAPLCPQATVETRALARDLAPRFGGGLHVSGCAKGCARPRSAATTLVGRNGRFDLVENGCAWDAPLRSGLLPEDISDEILTGAG